MSFLFSEDSSYSVNAPFSVRSLVQTRAFLFSPARASNGDDCSFVRAQTVFLHSGPLQHWKSIFNTFMKFKA